VRRRAWRPRRAARRCRARLPRACCRRDRNPQTQTREPLGMQADRRREACTIGSVFRRPPPGSAPGPDRRRPAPCRAVLRLDERKIPWLGRPRQQDRIRRDERLLLERVELCLAVEKPQDLEPDEVPTRSSRASSLDAGSRRMPGRLLNSLDERGSVPLSASTTTIGRWCFFASASSIRHHGLAT
jgi:hypothetical protein